MTDYTYSVSGDFTSGIDVGQFYGELLAAGGITSTVDNVLVVDDVVTVTLNPGSAPEEVIVDGLVAAHTPGSQPSSPSTQDPIVSSPPDANSDSNSGFGLGSRWIDQATKKEYLCVDATPGSAVWKETTVLNTIIVNQSSHGFSLTNNVPIPVYITGGVVTAARADNANTLQSMYIIGIIDSNNLLIQQSGYVIASGHALNVGQYYFLSESTAGALTSTETSTGISAVALYVVDSSRLLLIDNRPIDRNNVEKWAIKVSNTNTTTNLNTAGNTTVPITGTTEINENNFYTVVGNGVRVPQNRTYKIKVNLHVSGSLTRGNMRVRFAINGTPVGPIAAHGYIRNSSGHNETSYFLEDLRILASNDIITVVSTQEAGSGTTVMNLAGSSVMMVEAR